MVDYVIAICLSTRIIIFLSLFVPCFLWFCGGLFISRRKYFLPIVAVYLVPLVFFKMDIYPNSRFQSFDYCKSCDRAVEGHSL